MPIYEYECTNCGKVIEAMQKFSDPPLSECGQCHGGLRKLLSMSTFHLKGSGWYVTDYSGKKQNSTSTAKSETAGTEKTESTKSSDAKTGSAE
jgi:putative FmdB family regulatory protein